MPLTLIAPIRVGTLAALTAVAAALLTLSACSSGPASVSGTTWGSAPGTSGTPSITFETNGSLSGTDGCNVIGGDWKEADRTVELTMFSTMMYCEGVDMWLTESRTAQLTGAELVFSGENGREVGRLTQLDG